MNILVVCHYGLYQKLDLSFVHQQAKAYASMGHTVKALIPIAVGKKDWTGTRWNSVSFADDNVEIISFRYISLSSYGPKSFNTNCAISTLKCSLSKLLHNFHPDVIHAHTLGFDSEIGAWLKKKLGVPLVVTTHGSDTTIPYLHGEKDFLKRCCDQADAVVGVSSKLTEKLADCGSTTPLHSILNGFAINHLSVCKKQLHSWIQVGNLVPSKHQDITIQAFASHLPKTPDARFLIVGQGSNRQKLETLCDDLGTAHAVQFTGALPNQDALAKMAESQFFVMPSHPEGFGIVYLEAMANGCITIGTEGEGIADLIVSGENGFLVPPDDPDAIVRVIDWCIAHPEEAAVIAERGRRDALALTWEKNAKEYTTLFKELICNGAVDTK